MKPRQRLLIVFVFILGLIWPAPAILFAEEAGITTKQCTLRKGAEIIWDLNKHFWVCCIPAGEGLEKCIPITDMKPLPKTSLKPLPPKGSTSISIPRENTESNTDGGLQPWRRIPPSKARRFFSAKKKLMRKSPDYLFMYRGRLVTRKLKVARIYTSQTSKLIRRAAKCQSH